MKALISAFVLVKLAALMERGTDPVHRTGKRTRRRTSGTGATYWYIFAGDRLIGEIGKSTAAGSIAPTFAYTWGADGLVSQTFLPSNLSYYYSCGPQGETRFLKDTSGATQNTYTYNAYGALLA